MKKLTRVLLPALILALSIATGPVVAGAEEAEEMEGSAAKEEALKVYSVGDTAPNFALFNGITGEIVDLSKNILTSDAKLIALTFMNTTCSACQAEVALLSQLVEKHEGKLKVYLVAVDMRGERLVKSYNDHYKYNVEYLLDPEFSLPPSFGFSYTPALVLLNTKGEILYKKGGYTPAEADLLIKEIGDRI